MPALAVSTFTVESTAVHVVSLKDRTQRPHRVKAWMFTRAAESCIFGRSETPTGALLKLMGRISMNKSTLVLSKASVGQQVEQAEYDQIIALFRSTLTSDAKAKAKVTSLVPTSVVSAAAQAHGRTPRTTELLRGLSLLPRRWVVENEREALAEENAVDLLLEEEAEEDIYERLDVDLAMEIAVTSDTVFVEEERDKELMANVQLSPVPVALQRQLDGLESFRTSPFNRFRSSGGAVTDTTVGHDRMNALRFLSFCVNQKQHPADLTVLATVYVSELVEEYLMWLKGKGLQASSLANYCNSLLTVATFACTLVEQPDADLDQLVNLRRQCESIAKQEKLFQHKDKNWLDWPSVQQARVKALKAYELAPPGLPKLQALRQYVIISFHSLQAPDRVGVVRRLRFGVTLYKKDGCWTVDLTKLRHKTSRFYGPTIHTLSPALVPVVDMYHDALTFEFTGRTPYLFPIGRDYDRGVSSSQWCQMVKNAFGKFSCGSPPPKLLRASFITHMRSDPETDKELLESAAKAMKHLVTTGASDNYDKASHDRLLKKANEYALKVAAQYDPAMCAAAAAASSSAVSSFTAKLASNQPEGELALYVLPIPTEGKGAGDTYVFPIQPPLTTAFSFVVPDTTAPTIHLQLKLPKGLPTEFELTGLTMVVPQPQRPHPEVEGEEGETQKHEILPRKPVHSCRLPPKSRHVVDAALAEIGFVHGHANGNGDCFPLSAMAGFEVSKAEVADPTETTTALVRKLRVEAINLVCGPNPIGGIASSVVRKEETVKATSAAALRQMGKWKESYHWQTSNGHLASFFQFAIALKLERPVAVIQILGDSYLDPVRLYAAKDGTGALRKERAAPGKQESIHSYFTAPLSELLEALSASPQSMSIICYNGSDHFSPFLFEPVVALETPGETTANISDTLVETPVVSKAKKEAKIKVEAAPTRELTLEQALSGPFATFKILDVAPARLQGILEGDCSPLFGSHIVFNWQTWGWEAGRLGPSCKIDSNFSVLYTGNWREDQSLFLSSYGKGPHGYWLLIESGTLPPIVEYNANKYKVRDEWHRAHELVQYRDTELASARANATLKMRRLSQCMAEAEIDATGLRVGDSVFAKGLAPTGDSTFFAATIVSIRQRFPPIQVKYKHTLSGDDSSLLLPVPQIAYVQTAHVQKDPPPRQTVGSKRKRAVTSYAEQ